MDFALTLGIFLIGASLGGLIVAAWMSDRETIEPTEHGSLPL